jgi:hypothetical protein
VVEAVPARDPRLRDALHARDGELLLSLQGIASCAPRRG